MKKVSFLGVLIVAAILAVQVGAQEVSWEIGQHSTDLDALKQEISGYTENGYIPLGIAYNGTELYILYVDKPDLGMEAWSIEQYDTQDTWQSSITGKMKQGYLPTGITSISDSLYVLYVKMTKPATEYQLVPSGGDVKSVKKTIQPYLNKGYIPTGIAFYKNEYWTLLVLSPDLKITNWKIETYPVGEQEAAINANLEKGLLPWGVEYSGKDRIDILYISFNAK
jgi:hypothetical protein